MKLGCIEVARGLGWEQPLAETEALYAELLRAPAITLGSHSSLRLKTPRMQQMEK
jgi:hypothetical protein